jgi:hypothetical protein
MLFFLIFEVELVFLGADDDLDAMVYLKVNLFRYIFQGLVLLSVLVKVIIAALSRQAEVHKAFIGLRLI